MNTDWIMEFPSAITVCDSEGIIISMNNKSCKTFEKYGGKSLIGSNVLECHPEPARTTLLNMLKSGNSNSYTIEKNGIKKLIYQSPWYKNEEYAGFVELSIELPIEMPHFVRS
jgi:transcriptional regulator with PAS, ATPase and Fis domain